LHSPTERQGNKEKIKMAYCETNFKTKKELKEAIAKGDQLRAFCPGLGTPKENGREFLEGPHYPAPHTWYATVEVQRGIIQKVLS
jgi:hypothetical protein